MEPTVSVELTATDNYALQPNGESDLITQASAGLRVIGKSRRVRGHVDYTLTGFSFARHSEDNEVLHALAGEGNAELIESWAFVDANASVAQQSASLSGSQSLDSNRPTGNRTTIGRLRVSPYVKGAIGSYADYEVRAAQEEIRVDREDVSDVTLRNALVRFKGGGERNSWLAEATYEASDFSLGRSTDNYWARVGLGTQASSEVVLQITAGREWNNILTLERRAYDTWGASARWLPTERTNVSATYDKRYFGNAYSVELAHRTRQTAWSITSSRTASTDVIGGPAATESIYDLYFRQFESSEPDPLRRDALVRGFLQANGIDPTTAIVNGFLTSAVTEQRVNAVTVGLVGARNTITVRVEGTKSRRIDPLVLVIDDLSNQGEARQRGAIVEAAHRLTPTSSISATGVYRESKLDSIGLNSNIKSASLAWTGRTSARSEMRIGARYTVHNTTTAVNAYRESAIFGVYRLHL